jgi:hypothetical protein
MSTRSGMLIKNVSDRALSINMTTRTLQMAAGDEVLITADEVRDEDLRDHLQLRSIAIVRPSTAEEDATLRAELAG